MEKILASSVLAVLSAAGSFAQIAPPAPPAPPVPPDRVFEMPAIPAIPALPEIALGFAAEDPEGGVSVTIPGMLPQQKVFTTMAAGGSYLGVGVREVDAAKAKELKLPDVFGVEITRVEPKSPADAAGLKEGDVVLDYNGQRVEGTEQFVRLVRETPAGRQVKLHIKRGGANQTLVAAIAERPQQKWVISERFGNDQKFKDQAERMHKDLERMRLQLPEMPGGMYSLHSGMLGIEAESLSPQLAEFFGVKQGVLVRTVRKDSAAEKAGLKAGDVIVKVNGEEVNSPGQITGKVVQVESGKAFPLTVVRNRQEVTLNAVVEKSTHTGARPVSIRQQRFTTHPSRPLGAAQGSPVL